MKNFNFKKIFKEKNIFYFICITYLMYMLGFYFFSEYIPLSIDFSQKYILGADSSRYINGANKVIAFELPQGKAKSYLGYVIFIAFFQYFKLDLASVVLFQILMTFLSSLCIHQISKKFTSPRVAILVLSFYLFYLPIQMWNFYILTETIFICTTIFILYFFIFFKKKFLPLLIFLIIFYISLRPHGFILIPSLVLSLLIWLYLNEKLRLFYVFIVLCIISIFPILSLLNFYLENEKIVNSIINKGVIWGYENENNNLEINTNSKIKNDFLSLLILLKSNFSSLSIAFFKKIYFFYFRIRPYYSDFHNFYIIVFNLLYFPAAFIGFFKFINKKKFGIILMYSLTVFFTLAVGLTWADWDGRFSLYILPMIFIFSGVGFIHLFSLKIFKIKKN